MQKFFSLLLLLPTLALGADKLVPLSEPVQRILTSKEKSEFSDLGYVGIRCAALHQAIAEYLDQLPDAETQKKGRVTYATARANTFMIVGAYFSAMSNKSEENTARQFSLFKAIYSSEIAENKQLNNTGLSEFIRSEYSASASIFTIYETIAQEIKAREEKGKQSSKSKL